MMVLSSARLRALAALTVLAVANVLLLLASGLLWPAIGALALTAFLPGALAASLLLGHDVDLDALERALLAIGLGFVAMTLGVYALHQWPGPLSRRLIVGAFDLLNLALIALRWFIRDWAPPSRLPSRRALIALAGLLLVAALLRLPGLGYSEFQGDEGRAVLRAAEVVQGNDDVLFLHKKGPVEILLPAAAYAATGRLNEATARLPFALSNLAALGALYALGRRWFGSCAGLLALGLMIADGFWVGFARIVQYQSVVLLMTLLVVFCAYRVYQGARSQRYFIAAALCAAVGMLAHYEGFFALPPAAYLFWQGWRRRGESVSAAIKQLARPLVLGAALVAAFYIPFVLHPQFSDTAVYLTERRVGGGVFYNNIADYFQRAGFYNPIYYPLLLGLTLFGATGIALVQAYRGRAQRIGLGALAVAWLAAIFFPSVWQIGPANLAAVVFLLTLGLLLAARPSPETRAVALWFGCAALFYFFMMLKVHTHYYVTYPAWALIGGAALAAVWRWLERRGKRLRWAVVGVAALGWLLCVNYAYLAFLRHAPEWKYRYDEAKPWFYWSPYALPPRGGYFGFPYRTAWKAIGGLYEVGILQGAYDSNQEDLVTNWYTRGAMRCPGADTFIVARDVEDYHAIPPGVINGEYAPAIEIVRAGEGQLWVYRRGYSGDIVRYDEADFVARFDQTLSAPVFRVGAPLDEVFAPRHVVNARLGGMFELAGWELDRALIAPGESAILTLYWRTLATTDADHHVFAHLGDDPVLAQIDSVPRCGEHPTYQWLVGEQVVDRYQLTVRADAAPGVYPLRAGMYDVGTDKRLPIVDAQGADLGKSLLLGQIRVGRPDLASSEPTRPPIASLGEGVQLAKYAYASAKARPGDQVELTLAWRCLAPMGASYTVFIHLVGPDGQIVDQRDSLPQGGALPTNYWVAGEMIEDSYTLSLPQGAAAGDYRFAVGLYDAATGARLPAADADGQRLADDRILLDGPQVTP